MSPEQAVIVIGSGLAGLCATTQLIAHRIPVIMLERAAKPGGNSIKASSGINGAPTRFQPPLQNDSADLFLADTLSSAGRPLASSVAEERARRERLISTLVTTSSEAVSWLVDEKGVDLSTVAQLGGHSRARTHRGGAGQKPPGYAIVSALLDSLNQEPLFELRTNTRVTRVVRAEGDSDDTEGMLGVEYDAGREDNQTETLYGPLIFATGGFAGDTHGLLEKYRPDLAGIPSTNEAREGTQPLLEEVGAEVVDMDQVQVHPTGFVDEKDLTAPVKFLAAEALRGEGGILLVGEGKRFVDELDTREKVTAAVMKGAGPLEDTSRRQWDVTLLLDEGAAAASNTHLGFYLWKGLMRKTTVGELALPSIRDTLQDYAEVVSGKKPDDFGRSSFGNWTLKDVRSDSVVYVGRVTPVVHFTMGGVVINEHSQVLDKSGSPIKGLWAAGEITGGLHGQNRLGGSSLLECVVFGRIAGENAAAFHQQH
ncbi:putative FAD dependent oxidoreductase [Aspergillus saccharolyticus JOP 1030-1]|uniref:Fumarate reductase n=1 Tax=Aspergillus saccharolyticus JOP 1030-1 TaxID=1450539 RepID=A0A318ZHE6_9EURO|nr:putative FAD dependent oxidoreductase [Aspergillus saccharolyticus JOP 1030-1]PYH46986.1 putative FAD dependent oxidoreductase [Aspergillus saccharolyticus JOP 1030-1]